MTEFSIRSIFRHEPAIDRGEDQILATLTVEYGPILICGAVLLLSQAGDCRITLSRAGRNKRVLVRDRESYRELLALALKSYAATGGKIADPPLAKAFLEYREDQHEIA